MHCAVNFPRLKQISDRDIALPEDLGDEAYLRQGIVIQRLLLFLPLLLREFLWLERVQQWHL